VCPSEQPKTRSRLRSGAFDCLCELACDPLCPLRREQGLEYPPFHLTFALRSREAMRYHPDHQLGPGDLDPAACSERTRIILQAYGTLRNATKRQVSTGG
jgi:hypothetical protein